MVGVMERVRYSLPQNFCNIENSEKISIFVFDKVEGRNNTSAAIRKAINQKTGKQRTGDIHVFNLSENRFYLLIKEDVLKEVYGTYKEPVPLKSEKNLYIDIENCITKNLSIKGKGLKDLIFEILPENKINNTERKRSVTSTGEKLNHTRYILSNSVLNIPNIDQISIIQCEAQDEYKKIYDKYIRMFREDYKRFNEKNYIKNPKFKYDDFLKKFRNVVNNTRLIILNENLLKGLISQERKEVLKNFKKIEENEILYKKIVNELEISKPSDHFMAKSSFLKDEIQNLASDELTNTLSTKEIKHEKKRKQEALNEQTSSSSVKKMSLGFLTNDDPIDTKNDNCFSSYTNNSSLVKETTSNVVIDEDSMDTEPEIDSSPSNAVFKGSWVNFVESDKNLVKNQGQNNLLTFLEKEIEKASKESVKFKKSL
ncbi:MAG: hypothetical protein ACK4OM_05120 [Alphaproteobacteria bacterium]